MGWTSPLECTQEHGICLSFYHPILSRQCKRHPSLLYCYSFLRRNIQLSDMNPGPLGHTCTWDRTSVCMHRSAGVLLAGQADADCMKRTRDFPVSMAMESTFKLQLVETQDTMYTSNLLLVASIPGSVENQTQPCLWYSLKTNTPCSLLEHFAFLNRYDDLLFITKSSVFF